MKSLAPFQRKLKLLIFVSLCCLSISCDKNKLSNGNYIGHWAETTFEYSFLKDNQFIFKTEGHFGFTTTKGKYSQVDSIILLYPYTDWGSFHGVLKRRLIFDEKIGCLYDFDNHHYCSDTALLNPLQNKTEKVNDKIKKELLKIPKVIEVYSKYKEKIKDNRNYLYFDYDGIILIDNKQYHAFQLEKRNDSLEETFWPISKIQYHYYLVNFEDNLIYNHHSREDSLSIVGALF